MKHKRLQTLILHEITISSHCQNKVNLDRCKNLNSSSHNLHPGVIMFIDTELNSKLSFLFFSIEVIALRFGKKILEISVMFLSMFVHHSSTFSNKSEKQVNWIIGGSFAHTRELVLLLWCMDREMTTTTDSWYKYINTIYIINTIKRMCRLIKNQNKL